MRADERTSAAYPRACGCKPRGPCTPRGLRLRDIAEPGAGRPTPTTVPVMLGLPQSASFAVGVCASQFE
eukprot:442421-Alexandrium_andersonii.AAC.1